MSTKVHPTTSGEVERSERPNVIKRLVKVGGVLALAVLAFSTQGSGDAGSLFAWRGTQNEIILTGKDTLKGWRWNQVVPADNLEWHACHDDEYDCARLDVPLDWLNQSDTRKATLAITRYPAIDRNDYKGPVFINPGGPGGSGIWYVKHLGPYYQSVVGKNYDIISFDPRGIGATTPSISCWESSTSEILWSMSASPVLDAYPGALYEAYARASAFSQQCLPHVEEVGKYLTTASVARDMLHINEKLGEEKLKYWGFSYGTYIGATFAALYPAKIGRMVNDGVVDAAEFASGVGTGFLANTDAVMDAFFFYCHEAGSQRCIMYDDSPAAIQDRVDALLEKIRIRPIVVPASSANGRPEIVTFSKLRKLITSCLYQPLLTFPLLDAVIAALELGDGKPFISLTASGQEVALCDAQPQDPEVEIPEVQGSSDGGTAVLCTDAAPLRGGVEGFAKYLAVLEGISKVGGATMAEMALVCAKWPVEAKWRFAGPFEGNTSHPILFVANTADNVTPLRSAQANAKGFPGSVILISDSYGHTSLSTPSRCIASKVQAYFQTGELPPPNTICPPDLVPFEKWNMTTLVTMSAEEIELEVAMRKLMMTSMPDINFDARL